MAPPKTYRDYHSFDAYVDGVLLKRSSMDGIFAGWNQQSADAESLVNLLRRYSERLKQEGASDALQEQVEQFAELIYKPKAAETHEQMKQVLTVLSDFNKFLQSDAGNGVNHFSRLLRLASQNGFDLSQIGSGFRSLSESLELGLELDPDEVLSGPDYEAFVVSELLPDEEIFREKEEDRQAAPGTWIQRPEKRRAYQSYREYKREEINDAEISRMLEIDEPEGEALAAPRITSVEERSMSKPAKAWIRELQTTHDLYEARRDQQGNRIPRTDWLLRLLAVRSLVNARPGDKSFYQRSVSIEDINKRAEALAQDPDMRKFLESLKASPAVYASAVEYAEKGTGSGLDTWVKKYMAVKGLAPTGMLMARYLPSAELRVDAMKVLLKKRGTSPENRLDFVSQIVASRLTVDARRGGFTGVDERMKEAPGSEDFMQCRNAAKAALEKLSPNQLNGLLRKAQEGHGGKLLESFSELTGVNAANWRDQAREPDAREAGEEPRGLSL